MGAQRADSDDPIDAMQAEAPPSMSPPEQQPAGSYNMPAGEAVSRPTCTPSNPGGSHAATQPVCMEAQAHGAQSCAGGALMHAASTPKAEQQKQKQQQMDKTGSAAACSLSAPHEPSSQDPGMPGATPMWV